MRRVAYPCTFTGKVTGTFMTDHSEKVELAGEFADGKLMFRTTQGELTFTATMKDADT